MELTRTLAGIALFGTDSGLELISLEDLWIEMRLICQHTCVIFGIKLRCRSLAMQTTYIVSHQRLPHLEMPRLKLVFEPDNL